MFISKYLNVWLSLQRTEQLQALAPYHDSQYKGHIHCVDIVHPHPDTHTPSHNLITDTSGDTLLFRLQKEDLLNHLFRGSFSMGQGLLWLSWIGWFGGNLVRGYLYCANSGVNTPYSSLQPAQHQWARHLSQRKSLKIWHLKGKLGTITPLIQQPRDLPSRKKKKKEEKYEPEHATVATLLGSGEGIIRMDYPSFSCDLKIAEHTKSCPCVSGCLLFACIKVKTALCFLTLILCQWR